MKAVAVWAEALTEEGVLTWETELGDVLWLGWAGERAGGDNSCLQGTQGQWQHVWVPPDVCLWPFHDSLSLHLSVSQGEKNQ